MLKLSIYLTTLKEYRIKITIISIHAEKSFDNIQHSIMIQKKSFQKLQWQGSKLTHGEIFNIFPLGQEQNKHAIIANSI